MKRVVHVHLHDHRFADEQKHDPKNGQFTSGGGGAKESNLLKNRERGERIAAAGRAQRKTATTHGEMVAALNREQRGNKLVSYATERLARSNDTNEKHDPKNGQFTSGGGSGGGKKEPTKLRSEEPDTVYHGGREYVRHDPIEHNGKPARQYKEKGGMRVVTRTHTGEIRDEQKHDPKNGQFTSGGGGGGGKSEGGQKGGKGEWRKYKSEEFESLAPQVKKTWEKKWEKEKAERTAREQRNLAHFKSQGNTEQVAWSEKILGKLKNMTAAEHWAERQTERQPNRSGST